MNLVLVERARAEVWDENLPDAGDAETTHLVKATVPVVEVADDAHAVGARSPHCERDAADASEVAQVRAEFFVETPVAALAEEVFVERVERGHEGVWVAHGEDLAAGVEDAQGVWEELRAAFYQKLEEARGVRPRHLARAFALDDRLDALGIGPKGAHGDTARGR